MQPCDLTELPVQLGIDVPQPLHTFLCARCNTDIEITQGMHETGLFKMLSGASESPWTMPVRRGVQLAGRGYMRIGSPHPGHRIISSPTKSFRRLTSLASTMQGLFGGKNPKEALAEDAAHAVEAVTKLTSSGSELKGMPKR